MSSLADLQRHPDAQPAEDATLPLKVGRVRSFDTPEFAGMRFHEVETKSALNRVRGMPFSWSINPYRGCSHACSYCLAGETPILMADGRTKPLAKVQVGEHVYGTERHGRYRRYVTTPVRDHWQTEKPAYRITLEDGTRLIASGDHCFLTERGWKHVTGAQGGGEGCAHLTLDDSLMAVGSTAPGPDMQGEACEPGAALRVKEVEALGTRARMFDVTTGTGDFIADGVVSHNCFARPTHSYLNLSPGEDFEKQVVVKTNVAEVLRRELARPSWHGEHVAMGTNTDPYQRCEGRYRLMPGILSALADYATPFSILTKGTLITRDLEALAAAAKRVPVTAAFTIGMLDERVWRDAEPGTPSPRARLDAVARLNEAGIPTGVMLAPIMPGLNDDPDQLAELVDRAAQAGATEINPIVLHLRPGVREVFWPWLTDHHPELVERYGELYRGAQAAKAYRDRVTGVVARCRSRARRRHGAPVPAPAWRGQPDPPPRGSEQPALW
jgi:DNA repair photolyase